MINESCEFKYRSNIDTISGIIQVVQGFGGGGVIEILEDDQGGTYRAVYTVKFKEAVFVLHAFQKKSKSGIATPKSDIDLIHARLKVAAQLAKEMSHENH